MLNIHTTYSSLVSEEVKVAQSCLTLCDPMDYAVHGILQARILEWVAFPFSRRSSKPKGWIQVSHITGRFFTGWATREAQEVDFPLEWVAYPFSSESSQPRNQTRVSCIAGGFFTNWAIRDTKQEGINILIKVMYKNIHSTAVCNRYKLEITKMFTDSRRYMHTTDYYSATRIMYMNLILKCWVKDTKEYIWFIFIYCSKIGNINLRSQE